jgi:hypothetical protein
LFIAYSLYRVEIDDTYPSLVDVDGANNGSRKPTNSHEEKETNEVDVVPCPRHALTSIPDAEVAIFVLNTFLAGGAVPGVEWDVGLALQAKTFLKGVSRILQQ